MFKMNSNSLISMADRLLWYLQGIFPLASLPDASMCYVIRCITKKFILYITARKYLSKFGKASMRLSDELEPKKAKNVYEQYKQQTQIPGTALD
jgi:hypothetical protein